MPVSELGMDRSHATESPGEDDLSLVQKWLGDLVGLPQEVSLKFFDEAIDVRVCCTLMI